MRFARHYPTVGELARRLLQAESIIDKLARYAWAMDHDVRESIARYQKARRARERRASRRRIRIHGGKS